MVANGRVPISNIVTGAMYNVACSTYNVAKQTVLVTLVTKK